MDIDTLARELRAAGCHSAIAHSDHCRVVMDGMPARVLPIDGGLRLQRSVSGDDITLDAQRINEANLRVRYARYMLTDGQLVMQCDLAYDGRDMATRLLPLWRMTLADQNRLIVELAALPPQTI